jgi:acyl-CoA synthetase (AMP-forming)/AMP-acid ligase II
MSASLLTTMADRLDAAPGAPLYTFLDRHGKEIDAADHQEIVRRAAGTADFLQAAGVAPGDRVLLIFPPDGLEFVASFFGCVLLGAIAVPVASPDPRHLDRELPKLRHIAEDSGARVALTHAKYRALTKLASLAWQQDVELAPTRLAAVRSRQAR